MYPEEGSYLSIYAACLADRQTDRLVKERLTLTVFTVYILLP
jgi:hypothetical protein